MIFGCTDYVSDRIRFVEERDEVIALMKDCMFSKAGFEVMKAIADGIPRTITVKMTEDRVELPRTTKYTLEVMVS